VEVLELAKGQGAFIFWNHPKFATPQAALGAFHQEQVQAGRLHGVEIANGSRFYENALRLALKHNLTLIGTSDVHNLIDWDYQPETGGHRPVTLAFATEKSNEAAKEALFSGRTVVWWQNTLIGRPPELNALLQASLKAINPILNGTTCRSHSSMTQMQPSNSATYPTIVFAGTDQLLRWRPTIRPILHFKSRKDPRTFWLNSK
jgi:hypothetical protein